MVRLVPWAAGATAVVLVAAGCTPLPLVELNAYTAAYSDTQIVTNGVLDVVAPYERVVIRYASNSTSSVTVSRPAAPLPPGVDPSLLANPGAVVAPTTVTTTRRVVVERTCSKAVGGADPYCYELRAGFADIGDPPLVGAFRHLSNVVANFNALLTAYANGVTGALLKQELDGLSTSVVQLAQLPLISGTGAGAFAAGFPAIVSQLAPLANFAGAIIDREQLRLFLLDNYDAVDAAILLMARNSVELYGNVAVGTNLFRTINAPGAGSNLVIRRREIRRLIANWAVLMDENRRLLTELRLAVADPNSLPTRLRNLNNSQVASRIDTSAIKKQIATLGTPPLAP